MPSLPGEGGVQPGAGTGTGRKVLARRTEQQKEERTNERTDEERMRNWSNGWALTCAPDDIISLDRLGPRELPEDDVVVSLDDRLALHVKLPEQAERVGHGVWKVISGSISMSSYCESETILNTTFPFNHIWYH